MAAINYVIQNTPLQAQKNVTVQDGGFNGTTHIIHILPSDATTHTVSASSFNISNGTPQVNYEDVLQYISGVGGVVLPEGVDSVEFSDTTTAGAVGNQVKVTCNLNPSFSISGPVTLILDIDGDADQIPPPDPNPLTDSFKIFLCSSLPDPDVVTPSGYCHLHASGNEQSLYSLITDTNYIPSIAANQIANTENTYDGVNFFTACDVSNYSNNIAYRVGQMNDPIDWSQPLMSDGGYLKYIYKPHMQGEVENFTGIGIGDNFGYQNAQDQSYTISRHNCSINGDYGTNYETATLFSNPVVYVRAPDSTVGIYPGFIETTGIISSISVTDIEWPQTDTGWYLSDGDDNSANLPSISQSDINDLSAVGLSPTDWIGNRIQVQVNGLQGFVPNVLADLYGVCHIYIIMQISPMLIDSSDVSSDQYDISIDIEGETDINSLNGSEDG